MQEIERAKLNSGIFSSQDFSRMGALRSEIKFIAIILPWEISERKKVYVAEDGQKIDKSYWLLKDKFGASFMTRDEKLVGIFRSLMEEGKLCTIGGSVRILKGSTYFNAESCERYE